ncbi:PREDICTED: RING-H2 finger protein ATL5 [Theobroma cacao]|uniref:RING-type E3 ubiquitin transferase n=1 Tax=Theobroma cacao TaxID=3641 RepID=A0AB32VRT1_THECC|nr:PREDICTED: RING-H2 finger protein ATL5 [Theobroma cacao]
MDDYTDLPRKHINYAVNGKVMLCTGIVLFVALLIILCFHNYTRILFRNRRLRYIRRRAQHLLSISTATPTTVAPKGLDPSVIKTIPTFIYSAKANHFPPLECAVCLAEFENDEEARVLPKCNHTFHVDCIDMWFYSHSNCPLCRAPVQADTLVNPPKTLDQTVFPVAEAASSEPPREDIEMNSSSAAASSSSSSPSSLKPESCPMKTSELLGLGILVEVATGEDRLTSVADAGSGSGDRILSLKRIWVGQE